MNKILRYSFIALLAFICNVSFAGESTIDFTKLAITATNDGFTLKSGDFNFTAVKNNGGTAPTQNGGAKDLRLYAKNTLTITGAKITNIVFNLSSQGLKRLAAITASEGTVSTITKGDKTVTWTNTNGSTSITFTVGDKALYGSDGEDKAGQFDLNSVVITSDGQGGGTDPTPDPDPVQTVDNIAAFKALESGTTANLKLTNAVVLYKNVYTTKSGATNTEYYVRDATGAIQFFNTDLNLAANQVINGTVEVKYTLFNEMPEAAKTDNTSADKLTITDGTAPEPIKVTVADLAEDTYLCNLVEIENAIITTETEGTFTNTYVVNGNDKTMLYDKFKLGLTFPTDENLYNVTGILVSAKLSGKIVKELAPTSAPTTTGITTITANEAAKNAPAYNLAGQKVSTSYKGVVIKAGKKFVQK